MIRYIKKNEVIMILYLFRHSDMNFQTILMSKVIFAKVLSQKARLLNHSYVLYALAIYESASLHDYVVKIFQKDSRRNICENVC